MVPSPGQMPRGIPTLLIGLVCTAAGVPVFAQERLSHSQFETIRLSKIWLAAAGTASGQAVEIDHDAMRAARIVTAVRITERITFDGRLDEPVWMQAPPADDFLQKLPRNGAPATEKTVARFAYDEDNLYIGVVCAESEPDRILIKDLKEDFDFMSTDLCSDLHRQPARQADRLHVRGQCRRRAKRLAGVDQRRGQPGLGRGVGRESHPRRGGLVHRVHDSVQDPSLLECRLTGMRRQRRHAPGQLQPALQLHPPSAQRHLCRLQRSPRHDRRRARRTRPDRQGHQPVQLLIVYNHRRDTTGGELVERALIVKVTNLFIF